MLTYQINSTDKEVRYLFIDGGYLDKILQKIGKEFWDIDNLKIDYPKLGSAYNKVFYYNSLPGKRHGETEKSFEERIKSREEFYNELKLLNNFHVYEGVTFGRKNKIRQKAVDIMIAVDMLRHSFRKNMTKASLLTGDLDFKPLLDALVLEGMHTSIIYSKESISNELLFAADSNQRITIEQIHDWILDEEKKEILIPEFKINYRNESPVILKEGTSTRENITLLTRESNEFWLKLSRNEERNSTYLIYSDKDNLIRFYEDLYDIKINWK